MAKLIRNRSTPEKDAWWRAVQEAAKSAPKLTYERSAKMTTDDVLKLANDYLSQPATWNLSGGNTLLLVDGLAAEVRELRADLFWAVNNSAFVDRVGFKTPKLAYYPNDEFGASFVDCDGTPESICRAVREARDGVS